MNRSRTLTDRSARSRCAAGTPFPQHTYVSPPNANLGAGMGGVNVTIHNITVQGAVMSEGNLAEAVSRPR
jgi:hypothetical protein